MVCRVVK